MKILVQEYFTGPNILHTDEIPGKSPSCMSLQKKQVCDSSLVISTALNRKKDVLRTL